MLLSACQRSFVGRPANADDFVRNTSSISEASAAISEFLAGSPRSAQLIDLIGRGELRDLSQQSLAKHRRLVLGQAPALAG